MTTRLVIFAEHSAHYPVTAALRAAGLEQAVHFARYHAVLNRACWSALAVSRVLLALLVAAFASTGPVVIGLDDTIERRWGGRIKARGIYRDPVRSSHGHFVKTSGLDLLRFRGERFSAYPVSLSNWTGLTKSRVEWRRTGL